MTDQARDLWAQMTDQQRASALRIRSSLVHRGQGPHRPADYVAASERAIRIVAVGYGIGS